MSVSYLLKKPLFPRNLSAHILTYDLLSLLPDSRAQLTANDQILFPGRISLSAEKPCVIRQHRDTAVPHKRSFQRTESWSLCYQDLRVSNPRPMGHMRPRKAVNAVQHKILNLLKTFFWLISFHYCSCI